MKKAITILLCVISIVASSQAVIDGQSDYATDAHGYYYMITGGKFPTGTTPNGNNGSGGTFRYFTDSTDFGNHTMGQWNKDDWFPENASFALTLKNNGNIVYDNCGIEDDTYGNYYDAQAQGVASEDAPGLYRGYSMSNNYDWIYAGYFYIAETTTVDTLIGYFDAVSGFDPADTAIGYRFNIWSGIQDDPDNNPNSWMPAIDTMTGDIFSSDNASGSFAWSDSGVDRVFDDGQTDDIFRLSYTPDEDITLEQGVYFFSHDATVPEPATMCLLGLGGLGLLRRKKRA